MSLFGSISPHGRKKDQQKAREKEALQAKAHIKQTVLDLTVRRDLLEHDIQRAIILTRDVMKNDPGNAAEKRRLMTRLKLLLGQYWYLRTMLNNLETVYDQMQLMELTKEFGQAVTEISSLTKEFSRSQIDYEKVTRQFIKSLQPFSGGSYGDLFEEMSEALTEACGQTTGMDEYSDAMLEGIINGTTSWEAPPSQRVGSGMNSPAANPVRAAENAAVIQAAPPQGVPAVPDASASDDQVLDALRQISDALKR